MKQFFSRREFVIIFLIQVTEVLGFSLILPFLPLYAQEYGATPLVIASIMSLFSILQLISSPVLGRLSDYYGRRPLLIISQLSTFVSFIVLGFSNSLWMIFLSRGIDGLFGSNFTIAQAYISDISSKKDRSKAFGISGLAFGFGFLIGPALGGYLASFGYAVPSFVAAIVALGTVLATYIMLPETVKKRDGGMKGIKIIDVHAFSRYFIHPTIAPILIQFFLYITTHVIWASNFALYSERKLGFNAQDVGFVLAYVGFISIILRGGLLPKLIDVFNERRLQLIGVISIILGLHSMSLSTTFVFAMVSFTFFAFGNGLLRPLLMGSLSRIVPKHEQGAVIGTANSLGSLAQIVGPLIGGYLLTHFPPDYMLYAGMLLMISTFFFIARQRSIHQ